MADALTLADLETLDPFKARMALMHSIATMPDHKLMAFLELLCRENEASQPQHTPHPTPVGAGT